MAAPPSVVIVDIRDEDAYAAGHVPGSFSFPWARIDQEACGLPARNCGRLEVVCCASCDGQPDDATLLAYFDRLGFPHVTLRPLPHPAGSSSTLSDTHLTQIPTQGFCWSPNPFLATHISDIEARCGGPGLALDVGSGSGRDLVFLATRGWSSLGVENRLKLVVQANGLAAKHRVPHLACTVLSDVSLNGNSTGVCLRQGCVDLLHVCRFIHRPSLARLLRLVRPGGVVLYSHFLEGCEKTPVGRPKNVSGFFRRGELEALLVDEGLHIELSEEIVLPDGRPTINVRAERLPQG